MKKDSIAYVLGFMLAVSVFFGTAVSLVHHGTKDMLARNEQMHRNRTIAQAFGLPVTGTDAAAFERAVAEHVQETTLEADGRVWALFRHPRPDLAREPEAVGFEFKGQGVWDVIRGIIVLTPDLDRILSLRLLEQHETPGLGGEIEQRWFQQNFVGKQIVDHDGHFVSVGIARGAVADRIPDARQINYVDGISGATLTGKYLSAGMRDILRTYETVSVRFRQDRGAGL